MPGTIAASSRWSRVRLSATFPKRSTASTVARIRDRADLRRGQLEPDERVRVDRRPELAERDAEREVRGGRREEVAPVERARHRVERVRGVRELVRLDDAAEALGCGQEQPVVGADVEPALRVAQRERAARAADAGIDDREVHAGRHVRQRVRERERALEDPARAGSRA